MRKCIKCQKEKQINLFHKNGKYYRRTCKECFNIPLRTGKPNVGRFKKKDVIERKIHRNDERVTEWRKNVLERDNYQCTKCESKERLHVHHIIPWKENYEKRIEIENGQTLCIKCHLSLEHKGKKIIDEHRKKMSDAKKGKPGTWIGKKHSEESKRKISKSKTGVKTGTCGMKGKTPWNKGKKMSQEHCKKLSEIHLKRNKGSIK